MISFLRFEGNKTLIFDLSECSRMRCLVLKPLFLYSMFVSAIRRINCLVMAVNHCCLLWKMILIKWWIVHSLSAYVGMVREEKTTSTETMMMMKRRKEVEGSPNGDWGLSHSLFVIPVASWVRRLLPFWEFKWYTRLVPISFHPNRRWWLSSSFPFLQAILVSLVLPNSPVHNPRIMRRLRPFLSIWTAHHFLLPFQHLRFHLLSLSSFNFQVLVTTTHTSVSLTTHS